MQLISTLQREKMMRNCRETREKGGCELIDHVPVVRLFTPDANCTWLLTELDEWGIAFGLCDLGVGFPELGYVSLNEIASVRGSLGLSVERDQSFVAEHTLSVYAEHARFRKSGSV